MEDAELLRRTTTEPEYFGEFYSRHEDAVLRFMLGRVRDVDAAADLTAETFAAALLGVRGFDPARGTAERWLFGVARNTLGRSFERRRIEDRARRRLGMAPLALSPDAAALVLELDADARTVASVAALPEDEAAAVRARVLNGDTYAEMARDLSVSQSTARKRVSRGLARLRARKEST